MWAATGFGAAVFLIVVAIGAKGGRSMGRSTGEWLFTGGFTKIYTAGFGNAEPMRIAEKIGFPCDKYLQACRILRRDANLNRETAIWFCCIVGLALLLLAALFTGTFWFALVGVLILGLGVYRVQQFQKQAEARKRELREELPRFIDLFLTALYVGMPVEAAIEKTARCLPGTISEELKQAAAETQIGAKSWQQAMEQVALRYQVDTFNDFVLCLTTAYEKGVSITEAVSRKADEIRQINLLNAKERAAKLSNIILVPVMIFKILPLLAIMLIPIMIQVMNM